MNIYLLTQDEDKGYDTYDSMVVIAESEEKARMTHPSEWHSKREDCWKDGYSPWATTPENVLVSHIGKANTGAEEGIVLASFNAG